MVTKDNVSYLFSLKPENINRNIMLQLFNKKINKDADGKVTIMEPMFHPTEELFVRKGQLVNLTQDVESTVGLYFFNMFILSDCFGDKIPYVNKTITKKGLDALNATISNLILEEKIETTQFGKYQEKLIWLNNFTEILIAGVSMDLLTPSQKIIDLKKKLFEENKDIIKNNDVVKYDSKIEKPLLEAARADLKNKDGYELFELGSKPSFGNNYKNTVLAVGPILNTVTGKYEISDSSFSDGIKPEEQYLFANLAVFGAYSRGVSTQYGGAKTKELFAALQSTKLDEDPNYDCGTYYVQRIFLDEDNYLGYTWRYIKEEGKLILLTPELIKNYIGKSVNMRSPLFCYSDNICNFCAGDLFRRIGIINVGPATTKFTSTFLNLALKKMHDTTVNTKAFNPFNYIRRVK